jgi:hypothetical protein
MGGAIRSAMKPAHRKPSRKKRIDWTKIRYPFQIPPAAA